MKKYKIAVIPGDGIGPEVVSVAMKVLKYVADRYNIFYETEEFPNSGEHYYRTGEIISEDTLERLKGFDAIFLGALGSPKVKPGIVEKGILLTLRFKFDQYINLRPVKLYPGVDSPIKGKGEKDIDYIVVRENTGGLYSGIGGFTMKGSEDEVAVNSMIYNYKQVSRCIRYAFELARSSKKKKLALIGKTNVLTYVFDLWDRVFNEIGDSEFPDITREYYHVDAACMHMIDAPDRFDVIVTSNMFGDIITDLAAVTQGGMGMGASGNINPSKKFPSMFEPLHGSAPDIAGKNIANPMAAVISVKMMLDFLEEKKAADFLEQVICNTTKLGVDGKSTLQVEQMLLDVAKNV